MLCMMLCMCLALLCRLVVGVDWNAMSQLYCIIYVSIILISCPVSPFHRFHPLLIMVICTGFFTQVDRV